MSPPAAPSLRHGIGTSSFIMASLVSLLKKGIVTRPSDSHGYHSVVANMPISIQFI
jgi:hypothetical protein